MEGRAVAAGGALHDRQEERTGNARHAPGGEDDTVDGGQVAHAEEIGQISRHAGEAPAVAADNEEHPRRKGRRIRRACELPEGDHFNGEEEDVYRAAADPVGNGGPEDAAEAVHDADDAHQRSRTGGAHMDDFLCHGRCHGEQADAAGDIRKEDPPEGDEFRRADGFPAGVLLLRRTACTGGDLLLHDGGQVFFQLTGRRRSQIQRGCTHHHRIGRGHDEEIFREAVRRSEVLHHRACHEGGEAEAHDGQPGGKAAVPREPFHQRRHRRDVPHAEADAADEAVEEIEQDKALHFHRPGGTGQPGAEEKRRQEPRAARSEPFHEMPEKSCGEPEEQNGDGEGPGGLRQRQSHGLHHGPREHAPRIHAPDGDMEPHRGESDHPAISFHKKIPLCLMQKGAPPDAPGTESLPRRSACFPQGAHVVNSTIPSAPAAFQL